MVIMRYVGSYQNLGMRLVSGIQGDCEATDLKLIILVPCKTNPSTPPLLLITPIISIWLKAMTLCMNCELMSRCLKKR